MAKRLQVILSNQRYREIQLEARSRHMSISECVREKLMLACRGERKAEIARKLAALRAAVEYRFPMDSRR